MQERLQKILAEAGIGSRRTCEEYILQGRIKVNTRVVTTLGAKADSSNDRITFDGQVVRPSSKKIYLLVNKPLRYLSSLKDASLNRPIVTDLIKGLKERLYPAGRLDFNSEGLLILTNDGQFAQLLMHPKNKIPKTYLVKVKGIPDDKNINKLSKGVYLEDGKTRPAIVKRLKTPTQNNSWLNITISEGKNKQIRRMCESIGHQVIKLQRIQIGNLRLGDLKPGEYRFLTNSEIEGLNNMIK
ncbi:MAG: pseudouridine synthase [bacterium]